MFRYFLHAVPLTVGLLALFSLAVGVFGAGPAAGAAALHPGQVPLRLVIGAWLLEAFGLVAVFLLVEGRTGVTWLDGLLAGWVAWIFRGPLLVVTIVVAAGRQQAPWFRLALGWWLLYSVCGVALALLARWQWSRPARTDGAEAEREAESEPVRPPESEAGPGRDEREANPEREEHETDAGEPARRPVAVEEG